MVKDISRRCWSVSLEKIDLGELQRVVKSLEDQISIQVKRIPESGLDLLKIRDSVLEQPFYLGEVAVSECSVSVCYLPTNECQVGYSKILKDSSQLVYVLAICDALLAMQSFDCDELNALLEKGYALWSEQQRLRNFIVSETKVDFSLL